MGCFTICMWKKSSGPLFPCSLHMLHTRCRVLDMVLMLWQLQVINMQFLEPSESK